MANAAPPLQLVLIDEDATFRSGFCLWIEPIADVQLVAESGNGMEALERCRDWLAEASDPASAPRLVIISASLGRDDSSQLQGLALCRHLRDRHSALPILLLGTATEPIVLAAAQQAGASGYCSKQSEPTLLLDVIQRVALGQSYWPARAAASGAVGQAEGRTSIRKSIPGFLSGTRRNLRYRGIQQIEQALAEVNAELRYGNLTVWDQAVLAGRRRELRTARWMVLRLLATPALSDPMSSEPLPEPRWGEPLSSSRGQNTDPRGGTVSGGTVSASNMTGGSPSGASSSGGRGGVPPEGGALQPRPEGGAIAPEAASIDASITARSLRAVLFDAILGHLQGSIENRTDSPMETDILRGDKKRDLFYLILRKLEDLLEDLRLSQWAPEQLTEKRSQILLDLWEAVVTDFFGKYYTVPTLTGDVELVALLLEEAPVVDAEILDRIPYVPDLLAHLLFQTPLLIDGVSYTAGNPEAVLRAELLLSHMVIQVGNAVVQPLLNQVADFEVIKQAFYDRRLLSSREIERFRNDLSWRYRTDKYFAEPKDMFESQYRLLTFQPFGIKQQSIYAPRRGELEQLQGVPYLVTLALETRDAIAPRVRAAVSVVGSGLVYLLTEVIGRGIGLVGRGIAKGVGNVVQDTRYSRKSERQR
ncbi:MAG: DUF3685 domain-containing protein [Kaiparowitsia implicata GSE-PSE-MK54-09C]|jgi:DNA-binding NarL/FixJ family response regulator|nr:DUF3685 domain-containing protein [Kaiparowitsia implicata GSE-PSE-MK54-09C]